jgi:type I restriction enzyme S subunit
MKNEKLRVPKLRFKEFSGEWEEKRIGNIFKVFAGGDIKPENVSSIKTNKFSYPIYANAEKSKGLYGYSNLYKSDGNVITVAGRGVNIGIAHARFEPFYPIVRLLVLKPLKEGNIKFWEYQLNQLNLFIESTGVPQLTSPQISTYKIRYPQKQEQEKIASFLSSLDKKINQLSKKDELLQNYKKAMMQKIFSQKLRFKKADGSDYPKWEELRLKEVLDYEQPTKYIVKSTEYCDGYDIPVLTAGKTFILGYTNEKLGVYSKSPVIIFDDFTTANHYVDFDFKIKSSAIKLLKEKNKNINLKFVYEFIQRLHFPLGEHKRYWISEYSYLKIKLPCLEEQTKIANFLSSLDTKISQNKKALEETQKFKKTLLQKMFV